MKYWLFKSEPDVFSFSQLEACGKKGEPWTGVRNYQARNYMRDEMSLGDLGFFYHSSCADPGIAGVLRVISAPLPDPTQFDPSSDYFDPKACLEQPRWMMVKVGFEARFTNLISLDRLRSHPPLADMLILRKGNRLSITPVSEAEFSHIVAISKNHS